MNWLNRFILGYGNYLLRGLLLLTVLICGVQIGEIRIQKAWNVEKHQAAFIQGKQEQRVADTVHAQRTINLEISNEFQTKKNLLLGLQSVVRAGDVGLRLEHRPGVQSMPAVPTIASRTETSTTDPIPDSAGAALDISCEQLALDAAQTTLMLLEIQQWHAKQAAVAATAD